MAYLTGQALTQADIAALFTSGTYTPTLGNMVIGTGGTPTNSAKFTFVGFPAGGVLTVEGTIKFGTTAPTLPGASTETISLPSGYAMIATLPGSLFGTVTYEDVSSGFTLDGHVGLNTSTTVAIYVNSVSGAVIQSNGAPTATNPFTWAVNDVIHYRFSCRCTGP